LVRGDGFPAIVPLACLMHWYISALYAVMVVAVVGWWQWSSKHTSPRSSDLPKSSHAA
jgi:hypothetical protein